MKKTLVFILLFMFTAHAYGYIGPGLGGGALAVLFGIVGSFFLALFAIFWYPVKRLFKKRKKSD